MVVESFLLGFTFFLLASGAGLVLFSLVVESSNLLRVFSDFLTLVFELFEIFLLKMI